MPKKVTDILPNITPACEVYLFQDYKCIDHYPYSTSAYIGYTLADMLNIYDLAFPDDCQYVFYRFKEYNVTIKEYGSNVCIIIKKRS